MSDTTDPRSSKTLHDAKKRPAAAGTNFPTDQECLDAKTGSIDGEHNPGGDDQFPRDTNRTPVVTPGTDTPNAKHHAAPSQAARSGASTGSQDNHRPHVAQLSSVVLADPVLTLLAIAVDDLEGQRKAQENRLRILTSTEPDSDGEERGFGLDPADPTVRSVTAVLDGLKALERQTVLSLKRVMRKHPMGPFVKQQRCLGEKTVARLLGCIGDPAVNPVTGELRTFGQLVSYCGLAPRDGQARKRRRGEQVDWNGDARMRLWNIVQPALKTSGPYRDVYDLARVKYADAVHPATCERCGPKGKPAQPGSPLSLGHQHARAVRLMMRAVLRDLWTEARRLHGIDPTGEANAPTHQTPDPTKWVSTPNRRTSGQDHTTGSSDHRGGDANGETVAAAGDRAAA